MNNNLKQILQTTLNLTEAGLINLIAKYPESEYDFTTLNREADFFNEEYGVDSLEGMELDELDGENLGIQDLVQFVTVECAE